MGQGSTQMRLPQNMYDWMARAIGKLAQIIREHPPRIDIADEKRPIAYALSGLPALIIS